MPEERGRPTIELPADPLLRALVVYCVLGIAGILVTSIATRVLGLPAWLPQVVISLIVLGAPLAAAGAWLRDRRRTF